MRACEGCRRRKIKCDSATTNVWPCTSCVRLKLQCVRPKGQYDGTSDTTHDSSSTATAAATATDFTDSAPLQDSFRVLPVQQQPPHMMSSAPKPGGPSMYTDQTTFTTGHHVYQPVHYTAPVSMPPQNMPYSAPYTTASASVPVMGPPQQYAPPQQHMPSPPHQQSSKGSSPPETFSSDDTYQQQDLADLLGSLKMDAAGTGRFFFPPSFFFLFVCCCCRHYTCEVANSIPPVQHRT